MMEFRDSECGEGKLQGNLISLREYQANGSFTIIGCLEELLILKQMENGGMAEQDGLKGLWEFGGIMAQNKNEWL